MTEEHKDGEGSPTGDGTTRLERIRRLIERRPAVASLGCLLLATAVYFLPVLSGSGFFWDDYANYQFPRALFHAKRVAELMSPAYCAFLDCGRPIGMEAGHSIFYPPYLAIAPWSGDAGVFERLLSLVYVGHIFLAGAAMYLLCRAWGASHPGSVLGGMTYAFSSFMVLRMGSGNPSVGLSWLPLVILGMDRLRQGAEAWTWRQVRGVLLTGGALGALLLAGLLQTQVWVVLLVGAFGIAAAVRAGSEKGASACWNFCACGALAGVVGFALSSVFLLPAMEYGAESSRLTSEIYKDPSFQVPWRMALTNVIPHLFGRVEGPGSGEGWNIFWGGAGFWDYWERVSYAGLAGLLALLAAPIYLWRNRSVEGWLFFGTGVFAVLYMYGIASPVQYAMAQLLPPLQGLRNPVRASFLLSFAEAVLAARLFDWAWPREAAGWRAAALRLVPMFGLAAAIMLWGANQARPLVPQGGVGEEIFAGAVNGQLVLLVFFAAVMAGVAMGRLALSKARWLFVALVFFDLYRFGHGFNMSPQSAVAANAHTQVSQAMKQKMDALPSAERCRFEWNPMAQANLKSVVWEMDNFGGYCMNQPRYLDRLYALREKRPEPFRDLMNVRFRLHTMRDGSATVEVRTNALPRAWFVPTAIAAPKDGAAEMILGPGFDPRKKVVLEDAGPFHEAPAGAPVNIAAARLTAFDHTALSAESDAPVPGYVVFSELYFPGWEASVDGEPVDVLRANLIQRAVEVPAGKHVIEMRYRPKSFAAGLWLYIPVMALLAGIGLSEARKAIRRRSVSVG